MPPRGETTSPQSLGLQRSHYRHNDVKPWGDRPLETYLDALARRCAERPDTIFLDFEGRTYTFADIDRLSTRLANGLAARGVAKGQTVATIADNHEDLVVAFFAINKLGAIWVPINTAYRGEFLRHQMADSGAGLVICEEEYLPNLLPVVDQLPNLREIIVCGAAGQHRVPIISLDDVRGTDDTPLAVIVSPRDISCLIYTSGTTGPSKGCMISHNYLCSLGRQRNRSVPSQGENWITWSCLPLYHIAALGTVLISNLLAGERAAIARRFSVSGFWADIERSGAASAQIMASMIPLLARAPDDPAMLRCRGQLRVVTGVPFSPEDRKIWHERFGVPYLNTFAYGQTEANMVCFRLFTAPPAPVGSMGPPSDEYEVMVAGDDNVPVPIGETGELVVRPRYPSVMFSGYWNRPEDTLKAMTDLWWHTGDFVRMDENGYLFFVDRKKDYLRSRGENISSFEVESAIMKHPAVREVACHVVPGPKGLEEDIKATLVMHTDASMSETALFQWMVEQLPYFAIPRFIEFRTDLPKTPTGRIQKHKLRDEAVTQMTWDAKAAGFEIRRNMKVTR